MYFCHFKFLFSNERLDFFKQKIKRINNADLFPQPSLIIFTKGTNNSCVQFMFNSPHVYVYMYTHMHVYTYIYMCVCVCVCMCVLTLSDS